jgi:hypothetical protein
MIGTVKPDDLDDPADPGRHRQTTAPIRFEDGDRPAQLFARWFRSLRRRPPSPASGPAPSPPSDPSPDDLPEVPADPDEEPPKA